MKMSFSAAIFANLCQAFATIFCSDGRHEYIAVEEGIFCCEPVTLYLHPASMLPGGTPGKAFFETRHEMSVQLYV